MYFLGIARTSYEIKIPKNTWLNYLLFNQMSIGTYILLLKLTLKLLQ